MYLDSTYPTAVFLIIATEFCERFSFCGLRTILSLYLRNILLYSEDSATVIYHVFIMVCYVVPVVGAICADSYFGRYRTIRNFSLIYLLGNLLMCIAAIPILDHDPIVLSVLGLVLIAIGTGGLKPCVAAFGAEQFHLPEQSELLRYFFSIFYFTINLGGFVGMILTPIMRKALSCFGDDTCYALGFGFPAALMVISIPKRCEKSNNIRHEHWLDYSKGKFDYKLIRDMKIVFAILLLFVPLPLFWSLFDQQGSRWTFQASHMDGNVLGVQIVPDQMQVINPAMVMVLIPIFDKLFYPCCERLHLLKNSLHRMAIGGLVAGLAFISAGLLELILEKTYPELPEKNHGSVNVVNTLPCSISIRNPFTGVQIVEATKIFRFQNVKCHNRTSYRMVIEAPFDCGTIHFNKENFQVTTVLQETQEDTLVIGVNDKNEVQGFMTDPVDFTKSVSGAPKFRIDFVINTNILQNLTVTVKSASGLQDVYFVGVKKERPTIVVSPYIEVPQGIYECQISCLRNRHLFEKHFHFVLGGVYSLVIRENQGKIKFVKLYTISDPNSINMLWQLPQYFLISIAEIMFGIAGLEFSFTQAPKSMKTVTIAGWYLSTAVGNFLVIIITQLNLFKSQANEFFLFAMLIVTVMVVFMEMASKYQFVHLDVESSTFVLEPIGSAYIEMAQNEDD